MVERIVESIVVRLVESHELPELGPLEMRAGERFREVGKADVAKAPPMPFSDLEEASLRDFVWVVEVTQRIVAFAVLSEIDGNAHLEEISVDQGYGRKGIGSQLLEHVCRSAAERGYCRMTLSTFRDVPWNAPFYRSKQFVEMSNADLGPGLKAQVTEEQARGLLADQRVCMLRMLKKT